uniref:Uncharacterized protein n=1 Tax=Peduovirinae sp. ctjOQ18 TaxID=2825161 RepID=A0A8S5P0F4_9CAUD|nr:MAG TPA: hypothetical protein [Peduovirinae sp. ctjOQ18]
MVNNSGYWRIPNRRSLHYASQHYNRDPRSIHPT